jgi:recombinational DNA repair ATPase RecF
MPIDSLYLEKFRLFASKKIDLSPERTLIVGKNGSGKTSVLPVNPLDLQTHWTASSTQILFLK